LLDGKKGMTEVKVKEKITVIEFLAAGVLACLIFMWGFVTRVMAMDKYWVITGVWLPFIWLGFFIYILNKLSPKLRLSRTWYVFIVIMLYLMAGKSYYFNGYDEVNYVTTLVGSWDLHVIWWVYPEGLHDLAAPLLKPMIGWMLVNDPEASSRFYYGGGDPIWGPMIMPIITWTLMFLSIVMISLPQSFLFLGPQWWEDERVLFPLTIPASYVVNNLYTDSPKTFGKLFNFKEQKIFWYAFFVGIFINLPFIFAQVMPALPLGAAAGGGYGHYSIVFTSAFPWLSDVLPGAVLNQTLIITLIFVLMLLPFDVIASALFFNVIFNLIYAPVAIRTGMVSPGISVGNNPPFPFAVFGLEGGYLGLAVWSLWMMRGRIKKALTAFQKNYEEQGISMRAGLTMMIIGTILWFALWVAGGANIIIAILFFIIFTIMNIGGTRFGCELFSRWFGWHGTRNWQIIYPVGVAMGLWGPSPPQHVTPLAVNGFMSTTLGGGVGIYNNNGAIQQSFLTLSYGFAKGSGVDIRKIFWMIFAALLVMIPFSLVFDTWFFSHVGFANTGSAGMALHRWNLLGNGVLNTGVEAQTWGVSGLSFTQRAQWAFAGMIFTCLLAYLRSVFPWFWLHPIGFVAGASRLGDIGFVNTGTALVAKYLLVKTLGARRAQEYLVPITVGVSLGMGSLYLFLGAYIFSTVSWPNTIQLWT